MPTPSREIELFNISVVVPEHERFFRCVDSWHFRCCNYRSFKLCDDAILPDKDGAPRDIEAACCIAIVAHEDECRRNNECAILEGPRTAPRKRFELKAAVARERASNWRSVLAASRQRKAE